MNSEHVLEWQLGSWLGLSAALTWLLLALLAAGGVALTAWFYRHTLRALTVRQRFIFVALRSGFFLCLLLCLAGPARVERVYDSSQDSRPLAVLVDRSPSMAVADSRGFTRLASALRVWKKVEPGALASFPSLRYFRFADAPDAATDLENAVNGAATGSGTHLYDSLEQLLKNAPPGGYGGIVSLTDGLDTTEATPDAVASRAVQSHSPLYFCVGPGQGTSRETLLVREFDVPGQTLRRSQFTARVVVEARSRQAREVPLSLWSDNKLVGETQIHLHAGANLVPWTIPIDSGEPGMFPLVCRLGEGKEQEEIAAAVHVVAQEQINILFYQGSLDWSYRFINLAVQNESSFSLTGLFSPELNLAHDIVPVPGLPTLTQMPDKSETLKAFQIVVLSNIVADQMTPGQQAALTDYVKGGGGVLFLVSDTKMAATFSGTILESLMPVIFEAPARKGSEADSEAEFQEKMSHTGGADFNKESAFALMAEGDTGLDALKAFAFPAQARNSAVADLFGAAKGGLIHNVPMFASYARVHGIKAGGEVLAVHPLDKTAANTPRALLVAQRFGQGQVTALLTDGLWRWRMSLPSDSHDPEIFWQQLFRKLTRQESGHGNLRFGLQPYFAALGQASDFRLDGASTGSAPALTAISPEGVVQKLESVLDSATQSWAFQVKPDAPGKWRIRAEDGRGAQMETWLRVSNSARGDELSGQPPDVDGLRRLALSTGGTVLDDGVPDQWSASHGPNLATLVSKRTEPLWDVWPLLLLGLGCYVVELIWRRRLKLL